MDDYSLRGAKLYCAKDEDAKRCSEAYERDAFRNAQNNGTFWTPTRQMLIQHIRGQIDTHDSFRRSIRNLTFAVSCEAGAIVALLVRILLM